jgi:hypothetical protein
MKDANPGDGNNAPSRWVHYLGQFIDHDITLDLTSFGDRSRPNRS